MEGQIQLFIFQVLMSEKGVELLQNISLLNTSSLLASSNVKSPNSTHH